MYQKPRLRHCCPAFKKKGYAYDTRFDEELADLFTIATAFMYPDDLNNSRKVMALMREDVAIMKTLWVFEDERIQVRGESVGVFSAF